MDGYPKAVCRLQALVALILLNIGPSLSWNSLHPSFPYFVSLFYSLHLFVCVSVCLSFCLVCSIFLFFYLPMSMFFLSLCLLTLHDLLFASVPASRYIYIYIYMFSYISELIRFMIPVMMLHLLSIPTFCISAPLSTFFCWIVVIAPQPKQIMKKYAPS